MIMTLVEGIATAITIQVLWTRENKLLLSCCVVNSLLLDIDSTRNNKYITHQKVLFYLTWLSVKYVERRAGDKFAVPNIHMTLSICIRKCW